MKIIIPLIALVTFYLKVVVTWPLVLSLVVATILVGLLGVLNEGEV